MKKFVFIAVLSLLFSYCDAQKVYGVSFGYVPWGLDVMECSDGSYYGNYSFGKPALKLGFEIRKGVRTHLLEVSYSSINAQESSDIYNRNYKMNQIGLCWHPGWTIMPARRVQIPLLLGFGMNYYFGGNGPSIPNRLFFDISAMLQIKVYVIDQLALFGGYSGYFGANLNQGLYFEFRHYPEFGVLFNF